MSSAFHLVPDPVLSPLPADPGELPVPAGVSHPTLEDGALSLEEASRPGGGLGWSLEPLVENGDALLLLRDLGGPPVRVNGVPAPSLALVAPGDQLHWDGGPTLHVLLRRTPEIQVAAEGSPGLPPCPLCRTTFAPGTRLVRCPSCRAAYHFPETRGAAGQLECAYTISACASCRKPLHLTETVEPELEL